ncbi:MAG TPA: S-layer homology domain-containing protein, partial [Thermoanaerobaculia bacterium]|nr:S-layer homology domain-containing protein [Thermoanaerobaculia bacterium]
PTSTLTPTLTPTVTNTSTPAPTATVTPTPTVTPTTVAQAVGIGVDQSANRGQSDGNGILEPGETVIVNPSWKNVSPDPIDLTGITSSYTGPSGPVYSIGNATADYGPLAVDQENNCATATGNCYEVSISAGPRPSTHWDTTLTETLSDGDPPKIWTLHVGESFSDVPKSHVFYSFVEKLLHFGVTGGCSLTAYCPDSDVFRLQMAVFISRAQAGGDAKIPVSGSAQGNPYNCVAGGLSQFTDIAPDSPFCRHVHYIFGTGVTTGCVSTPPRQYCPSDNVTRGQMALFIGRAVAGSDAAVPVTYGPDPVTGRSYSCNPASPNLFFTDITTSDVFCRHTHYLWAKNVISGFADGSFGPGLLVTRGAMAKFISNGFGFTLYSP